LPIKNTLIYILAINEMAVFAQAIGSWSQMVLNVLAKVAISSTAILYPTLREASKQFAWVCR
jgi:hypothetical protein